MKTYSNVRALYIAMLLLLAGIAPRLQAQLTVSPTSISTVASVGICNVVVITSTSWTITNNAPAWLSITPSSGTGFRVVSLNIAANPTTGTRSGTFVVDAGAFSQTVTISQAGAAAVLTASPTNLNVPASGSSGQISINSNTSWIVSADMAWITVTPTSGLSNGSVSYTIDANSSVSSRTGLITISGGGVTQTIAVSQTGVPATLSASPTSLNAIASGSSGQILVNSNTSWTATSDQSWITVTPVSGSNAGTVSYTIDANTSTNSRSASITLTSTGVSQIITVTQTGVAATLTASPTNLGASATGSSGQISVNSNTSWTASSSQPWISISPATGSGAGSITYSVAVNTMAVERSGSITITGGGLNQTVLITQQGAVAVLNVATSNIAAPSAGKFGQIALNSNTNWTANSNQPWIVVTPTSGAGNGTLIYSIVGNGTTSPRTGTITITGAGLTQSIGVTQLGTVATLSVSTTAIMNVPAIGALALVTVNSNVGWTASSNQPWLLVTPANGFGNASVTYNAEANTSNVPRNAIITVIAGNTSQTISLTQEGIAAALNISVTDLNISDAGETGQIGINSNAAWTVSSNQAWITVTPPNGIGNGSVSYTVLANSSSDIRSGSITFAAGGIVKTVAVTQNGMPIKINAPAGGGINEITVTKGRNWLVAPNQLSWARTSQLAGSTPSTITLVVDPNSSTQSRKGIILIEYSEAAKQVASLTSITPDTIVLEQVGIQKATIINFTPTSGTPGTKITITGTNFDAVSSVTIGNSSVAKFIIDSPTQVTAIAAQGSSGTISITNAAGTSVSSQQFTYQTYTAQSLPSVNISMNSLVALNKAFTTLPAPKTRQFNCTVLSTSASGSLLRVGGAQKVVATLTSDVVLNVGDTFTYEELAAGNIVFKPNAKSSGVHSAIELSVPAGTFADDARVLTINMTLMATNVRDAQQIHSLNVYPNPATDAVTFEAVAEKAGIWDLQLINALGTRIQQMKQSVAQSGTVKYTVQLHNVPPGVYFLDVSDGVQHYRTRFVKQ